jgi:transposase InsO family protein
VLDWHRAHGNNVSLTARHFGISRPTIHNWRKRFRTIGIMALNDRSRRPQHVRQPTTSWKTVVGVIRIRQQYPAWSKYKIHPLLVREGMTTSVSTIGRILKKKGLIDRRIARKRRRAALHPKRRFPRGLRISRPGDLMQIDTKHVMLSGGKRHHQFTAIDVLTKRRVLRIYPSESSRNGAAFLVECIASFPFAIRAVQTDNGASFQKEFAQCCTKQRLTHYYIEPRSPKQNTYVEISHGADEREFYQQGNVWNDPKMMAEKLSEWERIWNEVRPHAALNYLTPEAYLERWKNGRLPTNATITLQA